MANYVVYLHVKFHKNTMAVCVQFVNFSLQWNTLNIQKINLAQMVDFVQEARALLVEPRIVTIVLRLSVCVCVCVSVRDDFKVDIALSIPNTLEYNFIGG